MRHRRQALAGGLGAAGQAADLAHDAAGEGDEVARRQAVGGLRRVRGDRSPSAAGETT